MSLLSVQTYLPPIPLTSEDTASPERGGEGRREQELRRSLSSVRQVREGRRRGSSLTCQMFIGGLKRTSGH